MRMFSDSGTAMIYSPGHPVDFYGVVCSYYQKLIYYFMLYIILADNSLLSKINRTEKYNWIKNSNEDWISRLLMRITVFAFSLCVSYVVVFAKIISITLLVGRLHCAKKIFAG